MSKMKDILKEQKTIENCLRTKRGNLDAPPPCCSKLSHNGCFDSATNAPILANILLHFLAQGRLETEDAAAICQGAARVLSEEENVLKIKGDITIVGDLHGQFYDLAKIITMTGDMKDNKYLFLGNYIGGGGFSNECILFLLAAKLAYPDNVFLLRGNHESRFMADLFGFENECMQKYSKSMYNIFLSTFNRLPLAATIAGKYFCVHGGLSPDISRIEDIQLINRFREAPSKGGMCDLLWSDPYWDVDNPSNGLTSQSEYYTPGNGTFDLEPSFVENEQRGCSYIFNFACVKHFANVNKILCIIRSHEVQDDGYKLYRAHPNNNYPALLSVFSAPNYCDTFENKGAIVRITNDTLELKQFFCSPHPLVLPQMNAFSWSLPFMADNINAFFTQITEGDQ
ncbi:serine/threonine protein phosphatase 2b catalytic subunit A2 [Strigomonas culicis]|uniref:Serine/threonine-protein phosphatase n=2 Tax=Strigomonas culicis TaxID=28005 RepID=S9UDB2_9TRYP|nr:serine/threonine protein phosphatase 2b catalytic subunit A2 [Strigomonas culicis]|eukprot:EPY26719.1 serine/threonine protein phosphatase 2b catalytic subunit A2 [Strigomonas culicis]